RMPHSVAVIHGNQGLTYDELNSRADAVAAKLAGLGAGPEKLVAVCLERNLNLVSAIMGTLKSGSAYVALDPAYPKDRIEFMLNDSKAAIVLTQRNFADRFAHNVLCIEDIANSAPQQPATVARPENLAYVIYTSGSTGRPKGVAIEHRSAVNLIAWARTVYTTDELDGVLASTSVCFGLSVFELFVPLCLGGKVILAENALALPTLPTASAVTLINTVPSAMAELLRAQAIPASVRTVNLAGEALQHSLVQ